MHCKFIISNFKAVPVVRLDFLSAMRTQHFSFRFLIGLCLKDGFAITYCIAYSILKWNSRHVASLIVVYIWIKKRINKKRIYNPMSWVLTVRTLLDQAIKANSIIRFIISCKCTLNETSLLVQF